MYAKNIRPRTTFKSRALGALKANCMRETRNENVPAERSDFQFKAMGQPDHVVEFM